MTSINTIQEDAPIRLRILWAHVSFKRKASLLALLLVMLISSITEVISLASVLPFLSVLVDPNILWNNQLFQRLVIIFGINSSSELLLPITLLFAFFAFIASFIKLLNQWLNRKWAADFGSEISTEIYRRIIYQPYEKHLKFNSTETIATISGDVNALINGVVNPLLSFITSLLLFISLIITLLLINKSIAIFSSIALFIAYYLSIMITNRPLFGYSLKKHVLRRNVIKNIQESIGSIRDIILSNNHDYYIYLHKKSDEPWRRSQADILLLTAFPKAVVEPIGIALIAIIGFILVKQGDFKEAFPLLGALGLSAQKIIPLIQKIYESWAALRSSKTTIIRTISLLETKLPPKAAMQKTLPYVFRKNIIFNDVDYRYDSESSPILSKFNLKILKGERIGIIGTTGSGKSTTMDLFMGLLVPTNGRIILDDNDLHDPLSPQLITSWRASIAHVPQSIYLADSSIKENIAFGITPDKIDMARVLRSAEQAHLAGFIDSCPKRYETLVGERGVRLSGGQKQRIGIARALYKRANVIVLDEATSALDDQTENEIINVIEDFDKEITVLMIAHRLSTVARCDRIIRLERGVIVSDGPPEEVLI